MLDFTKFPIEVPYPPTLFVGTSGTYAVGGIWVRVPDGTLYEELYKYVVCNRKAVAKSANTSIRKFNVKGSKGDMYTVTCSNDSWSCSCVGWGYNRRCKHVTSAQDFVSKEKSQI